MHLIKLPGTEIWANPDHIQALKPASTQSLGGGRPTLIFLMGNPDPLESPVPITQFLEEIKDDGEAPTPA